MIKTVKNSLTTHNYTFTVISGKLCNEQELPGIQETCRYGHDLKQLLHGIHDRI